jgi:hypothetical protein
VATKRPGPRTDRRSGRRASDPTSLAPEGSARVALRDRGDAPLGRPGSMADSDATSRALSLLRRWSRRGGGRDRGCPDELAAPWLPARREGHILAVLHLHEPPALARRGLTVGRRADVDRLARETRSVIGAQLALRLGRCLSASSATAISRKLRPCARSSKMRSRVAASWSLTASSPSTTWYPSGTPPPAQVRILARAPTIDAPHRRPNPLKSV